MKKPATPKATRRTPARPSAKTTSKVSPSLAIDAYLAALKPDQRATLQELRKFIRSAVPEAVECISYGLPAFRLDSPLVAFGATKSHCAFYPLSGSTIEAHKADLVGFETSKGTIRFLPDHPLPKALILKLLQARIAENQERRGT